MKKSIGVRFLFLIAILTATTGFATTTFAQPSVGVVATNATAAIDGSATGLVTFTRTGVTTNALTINYSLSGTAVKWNDYHTVAGDMPVAVTIPAGAASTIMTIVAVANTTNANPETATFTLSANSAYTVGAASTATLTITPTAPVPPTVTVVLAAGTATLDGSKTGLLVFTRTGSTATALTVNYSLSGTAVKWNDYHTIAGDMPVAVTIPGGLPPRS